MTSRPIQISCIIITKNEADRIVNTLEPLKNLVDEILVVDSGSIDDTVNICRHHGATVIHNSWIGYGPQKRFAEDHAKYDWILNLDGDEVLKSDLIAEIAALKKGGSPALSGYRFKQITIYPGKTRPRLFADYNNCIRLYDKRVMRFRNSLTHDAVDNKGLKVGQLRGWCYHFSFRSIEHLIAKLEKYTTLQAEEFNRPAWKLRLRLLFEYPFQFLKYMVLRRNFTGGLFGLRLSHEMAKSKVSRISKLLAKHEQQRQKE